MGFSDWLKDIVSVPENDEPEYEAEKKGTEEAREEVPASPKVKPFRQREPEHQAGTSGASNIKVVLAKPESFEDGRSVADHLNAKRTVVLNLESTNREISRRLIDFLSGVAYANDGQLKRVANCTYIITPRSVDVMGDMILGELESSGLFDNV